MVHIASSQHLSPPCLGFDSGWFLQLPLTLKDLLSSFPRFYHLLRIQWPSLRLLAPARTVLQVPRNLSLRARLSSYLQPSMRHSHDGLRLRLPRRVAYAVTVSQQAATVSFPARAERREAHRIGGKAQAFPPGGAAKPAPPLTRTAHPDDQGMEPSLPKVHDYSLLKGHASVKRFAGKCRARRAESALRRLSVYFCAVRQQKPGTGTAQRKEPPAGGTLFPKSLCDIPLSR